MFTDLIRAERHEFKRNLDTFVQGVEQFLVFTIFIRGTSDRQEVSHWSRREKKRDKCKNIDQKPISIPISLWNVIYLR